MASNSNQDRAIATSQATSACPVMSKRGASSLSTTETDGSQSGGFWSRFFPRSYDVHQSSSDRDNVSTSQCPVRGSKPIPASIEEAANHSQIPAPGQRVPLSTHRVISSIPRGEADSTSEPNNNPTPAPAHQPPNTNLWMYPSEQQFYNAMLKKGYQPPIESIPSVLRIHNAVNERSWLQVCKWEKDLHGNADPKLVKFVGRPKDLSPKAWFNSRILMTQEPFDRHDWYVETEEEPRRYVIDFYEGKEQTGGVATDQRGEMKPPSMYIDVRPALDNPSAAVDRMTMFAREALPGIASVYDSYKSSSGGGGTGVDKPADVGVKATDQTGKQ